MQNLETFKGNIPNEVIPIGESSGGNQICLGISKATQGRVYFWDHEHEAEESNPLPGLCLVANSFSDFVKKLDVNPEQKLLGKDSVVEVWIDKDLLP